MKASTLSSRLTGQARAVAARIDVVLQPGEYAVADHRHRILTLLGSCVSITLWHPARRIGAMSHFLVPGRQPLEGAAAPPALDARYGDEALALMLQGLKGHGVAAQDCEAKVFGGGDMFPKVPAQGPSVGRRNGEMARQLLKAHGLVLRSESLFGKGHRKIVFDIADGSVWSRQAPLQPEGPAA